MLMYTALRKSRVVWPCVVVCLVVGGTVAQAWGQGKAIPKPAQPKLFVELTGNYNTPDGMALLPNGDVIMSVPNFNDLNPGAFMVRISPDNKVSESNEENNALTVPLPVKARSDGGDGGNTLMIAGAVAVIAVVAVVAVVLLRRRRAKAE